MTEGFPTGAEREQRKESLLSDSAIRKPMLAFRLKCSCRLWVIYATGTLQKNGQLEMLIRSYPIGIYRGQGFFLSGYCENVLYSYPD